MNILIPIAGRDRYFPEGQFVFPNRWSTSAERR
jgi:hypothetical protein